MHRQPTVTTIPLLTEQLIHPPSSPSSIHQHADQTPQKPLAKRPQQLSIRTHHPPTQPNRRPNHHLLPQPPRRPRRRPLHRRHLQHGLRRDLQRHAHPLQDPRLQQEARRQHARQQSVQRAGEAEHRGPQGR